MPVVVSAALFLSYNHLRFGDPFETGYRLSNNATWNASQRFELLRYGVFQFRNIPTNFYYYFIKTVDPVLLGVKSFFGDTYVLKPPYVRVAYPGAGFFVTAPFFIYLFRANFKERVAKHALIPIVVILPIILAYYWPGWTQVGPRYTLDFLPFAFLLTLTAFSGARLSTLAKMLILGGAFFNLYLVATLASPV